MKMRQIKQLMLLSCVVLAVGCSSKYKSGGGSGSNDETTGGVGDRSHFYGQHVTAEQEARLLNQDTYYLGYDQYVVSPEDKLAIYANAKKLMENPNLKARVEGHTDERGSHEYNIGLGERRARAVAAILAMKGVPDNQIRTLSYGKEKPASLGHSEDSWGQNRRAMIVYED